MWWDEPSTCPLPHVQSRVCPLLVPTPPGPGLPPTSLVLLTGPAACEVDGPRGPVRPDLHPPERRVSLKEAIARDTWDREFQDGRVPRAPLD